MRLALSIIRLIIGLFIISSISSCSDKSDELFIKRDTDELSFNYKKSNQQFTVRTNGSWNAVTSDEWIQLSPNSGTGNGKDYEYVTVTVLHNTSSEREGIVYLEAAGKTLEISVYQEDGILAWNTPYLDGTLLEGEKIADARIIIPYIKASGDEVYDVDILLKGDGATGIACESIEKQKLTTGDGAIILPLSGIPMSMGDLSASIKLTPNNEELEETVFNLNGFVSSDNIVFEMTFDKLVWGGDYINNLPGVSAPTGYGVNATDETTRICKATDDGTSDLMASAMNAAFRASRGITEWSGSKVYEKPGYVKVGTGTAKGYIISPKLDFNAIGCEEPSTIYVQFNWCRWDNENDPITVNIVGDGDMEEISLTEVNPLREWQLLTIKIENATSNTQVRVGSTVAGNNRFFIDNWKVYVSKATSPTVTSKLSAPTGLTIEQISTSSLKYTWDKHPFASSYLIELRDKENKVISSQNVKTTFFEFDNLTANTTYSCCIKALYSPNSNFDSDFSNPIEGNTLAGEKLSTPELTLFKATHGMLIFDFGSYIDGSGESRIYTFELSEIENGAPIRSYTQKDLDSGIATTTGDLGTGTRLFFTKNRIAFAALDANKRYYLRAKIHAIEGSPYIDSDYATCSAMTENSPFLDNNVLLYKDFEDFWWGGNSINLAWGPMPLVAPINEQKLSSSLDFSNDFHIHYPIRNAGDSYNTLNSTNAPEYFQSRWGSEEWSGSKVYEVCGHIKLGTSTATGYLTTPPLSRIGSGKANLTLKFKAAPYHEPSKNEDILELAVKVVGSGSITSASSGDINAQTANLINKTNVSGTNLLRDEYEWTDHEVKITGADANTRITITTATYDKNNSSRKIRMWVDDIMIIRD